MLAVVLEASFGEPGQGGEDAGIVCRVLASLSTNVMASKSVRRSYICVTAMQMLGGAAIRKNLTTAEEARCHCCKRHRSLTERTEFEGGGFFHVVSVFRLLFLLSLCMG